MGFLGSTLYWTSFGNELFWFFFKRIWVPCSACCACIFLINPLVKKKFSKTTSTEKYSLRGIQSPILFPNEPSMCAGSSNEACWFSGLSATGRPLFWYLKRFGNIYSRWMLMEKILHQLISSLSHYLRILYISRGAGFQPSTVVT